MTLLPSADRPPLVARGDLRGQDRDQVALGVPAGQRLVEDAAGVLVLGAAGEVRVQVHRRLPVDHLQRCRRRRAWWACRGWAAWACATPACISIIEAIGAVRPRPTICWMKLRRRQLAVADVLDQLAQFAFSAWEASWSRVMGAPTGTCWAPARQTQVLCTCGGAMLAGQPQPPIRVAPGPDSAILRCMSEAPPTSSIDPRPGRSERASLVLDSPHSGSVLPPDFGAVPHRIGTAGRRGLLHRRALPSRLRRRRAAAGGAVPAHLPRRQPPRRRHRPGTARRPLAASPRAQRQGAHRQGPHLAHAGRRPADLRPRKLSVAEVAAPHRRLPPPLSRRPAAACSMRPMRASASCTTSTATR